MADKDEVKGNSVAQCKDLFFGNRRFVDKRMGNFWVEPKHFCIFRRRGLEDVRINALLFQEVVVIGLVHGHADDPFKDISKTTAKGRAFLGRKAYVFFGVDDKSELCQSE